MKKFLIVVDMQNDFVDGALGTPEAVKIVPEVVKKIKSYPKECIYATRDTHGTDYFKTREGKFLPVEHCIIDTPGWQINDEVAKALGDVNVIDKETFGSTKLAEMLKKEWEKEPFSVELVGLCTDICVVSNALLIKAQLPECDITVDAACCAGVTPASHLAALLTMEMCQITVTNKEY